jgi:molecular chaperone GrpE
VAEIPDTGRPVPESTAADGPPAEPEVPTVHEAAELRRELDERTADLQRVLAEYANFRKRTERDRDSIVTAAQASLARALLPVFDDFDRAEEHGDLTGPVKEVVDRLVTTLAERGLQAFGMRYEPFDPAVHEAVHHRHSSSPEVVEPTVTAVLRHGYRFGDRLLRTALVEVTEPEPELVDEVVDDEDSAEQG